ncbi:MAG: L-threonylcarbamoyladenylate synthase [Lachnospiraceae bacterium]|uniref:L-threonylcarbamoyladenylate synthase n=1 Tax=Falcatimonas sp. MSJ-15 TaxID=2841515 RepID=UPI001C110ED2|nr:L-threonylcarbamoyladenylate synthase [Falcatimonas sp. MSJ-15]MBQ5735471.1 threonylcarbamoyl-AMP synthase [Lachnospiraceae bacterium]MBU5469233.1 threonylcarbamoyl-AMP synthase [Falcatimonas sp. MSJ-15]MEE0960414.1 L-threonylcarbamoyladenylate synthase [Lachnospiraceae bacterium]
METKIIKISEDDVSEDKFREAGQIIRDGGLVAFATETVYGLGADALNKEASAKIYAAKGRPSDNPLIVHIADVKALDELAKDVDEKTRMLAEAFWPGPLTMIVNKSDIVPYSITGGLDTVAIRMPNHRVALGLIKASGRYIAAPSANTSGRPSTTKAEHVIEDLNGKIDMIIDSGAVKIGLESTIVDMTSKVPTILRPGYITREALSDVIGEVEVDKAITEGGMVSKDVVPKAPGMKYRHYAPKAALTIVEGEEEKVIKYIEEKMAEHKKRGEKAAVMATDESMDKYSCDNVFSVGRRKEQTSVATHLFAQLRDFDDLNMEYIYSESFSRENIGQAIMNRLMKAAGGNIVRL